MPALLSKNPESFNPSKSDVSFVCNGENGSGLNVILMDEIIGETNENESQSLDQGFC